MVRNFNEISHNFGIFLSVKLTLWIGTISLREITYNQCETEEFNQLKDNIDNLIDGLVPNGKESNNLFTGKYLIDSLQYTDVWQGCTNYLNSLIGVKSVVSIKITNNTNFIKN